MRTVIRTWGNSLAVRIPRAFALHVGIASGTEVELSMEPHGLCITSPSEKLDALLERVTTDNLHAETGTGAPKGREVW